MAKKKSDAKTSNDFGHDISWSQHYFNVIINEIIKEIHIDFIIIAFVQN